MTHFQFYFQIFAFYILISLLIFTTVQPTERVTILSSYYYGKIWLLKSVLSFLVAYGLTFLCLFPIAHILFPHCGMYSEVERLWLQPKVGVGGKSFSQSATSYLFTYIYLHVDNFLDFFMFGLNLEWMIIPSGSVLCKRKHQLKNLNVDWIFCI